MPSSRSCLLLCAACAIHDGAAVRLGLGLNHMWTTPIMRSALLQSGGIDEAVLRSTEAAILRHFRAFSKTCIDDGSGETVNDRFFTSQCEAWDQGRAFFLETGEGSAAYGVLRDAWLTCIKEYVAEATSTPVTRALFEDETTLRLFVWASVHEGSR